MHRLGLSAVCALVGLDLMLGATAVSAQSAAVVGQTVEATATVETVDARTRQVLLHKDDGSYETMVAGPEVRNFAQIKPGDRVHARYASALAARLGKPDQKFVSDRDVDESARARPGQKPGGGYNIERYRTIKVTGIDLEKNTLSFVNADNEARTVEVRAPQMRAFLRTLKVGDTVNVAYREAAIMDVEPAK